VQSRRSQADNAAVTTLVESEEIRHYDYGERRMKRGRWKRQARAEEKRGEKRREERREERKPRPRQERGATSAGAKQERQN